MTDTLPPLKEAFDRIGLTPAESRVALAVAGGESLGDFAQRHNVSLHTVRNQLKSVFAKSGVSRQLDLALLVHRWKNPEAS